MKKGESRSELMKRNSRSLIMYSVSKGSRVTRAQIIKETGLSRAHACGVVDELIAEGELIETGSVSAGRGRPTIILEVNHNNVTAGGVWLAEDFIEVGIARATGEILARQTLPYSGNPSDDIDAIADAISACAGQAGRPMETLRGIGVVVGGLVNPALGLICITTHDHGFVGVPIAKLLSEKTGIPVYADTDIRAAAVAHQWHNAKSERVLYVQFGDGVGAAFVVGGEVFGGAHGAAPLLGYTPIGLQDGGFLEPHVSNFALVESLWPDVVAEHLPANQLRDMVGQGLDLVARGDHAAVAAITTIAEYMGLGVAVGISMLDPQKVFITGTLIDSFPDMMVDIIRRSAMPRIDHLFRGVDIQPLVGWREFEFRGAFGLVLFNGFRAINRDMNAKMITPWSSDDGLGADDRYASVAARGISQ